MTVPFVGAAQGQDFFTLKGHGGPIMGVAVSPSGEIATASFDNSVGQWTGSDPRWHEGHAAAVTTVTYAGEEVILSGGDDFSVRLWSDTGGAVLAGHTAKVTDLEALPDLGLIASASWDASVGIWRASDTNWNTASWQLTSLRGHTKGVNDVALSTDGGTVYSASADGTIRVWDVASGQETAVLVKHGFGVNELILNEGEGWLAYGATDGGTRMIDLDTGAQIADFTLDRRPVLSMAYHPESHQIAVGDGQGYIMVIDTQELRITRDFKAARNGPIWALAFSPNGQNLHAGGIEDTLYSWPIATMAEHGQMATATRTFLEDPKSLPNGERQFKRKCSICHTLTEGSARKAGPSLYKLFGKRAGTEADYSYSDILQGSKIVWSAETINDLFDLGPDHFIPGTKMPMQRIANSQDRDDLIDYLRQATAGNGE